MYDPTTRTLPEKCRPRRLSKRVPVAKCNARLSVATKLLLEAIAEDTGSKLNLHPPSER